jgi:hypothetical protein
MCYLVPHTPYLSSMANQHRARSSTGPAPDAKTEEEEEEEDI